MERYIAIDVETPNAANDRISAIGICTVEDGAIQSRFYTLVDPETYFAPFNVQLTGITPAMVQGQPTFSELWPFIRPMLESGVPVAHFATFDLGVLSKCLCHYAIPWKEQVAFACTCQMGRRLLPQLPNHKLNTLCQYLEIPLEHHHAGSDSQACGALLCHYLGMGARMEEHIRCFDMQRLRVCHPGKEK